MYLEKLSYKEGKIMFYVVIREGKYPFPINAEVFKTFEKAEIARIYYQPEFDELLLVKEII